MEMLLPGQRRARQQFREGRGPRRVRGTTYCNHFCILVLRLSGVPILLREVRVLISGSVHRHFLFGRGSEGENRRGGLGKGKAKHMKEDSVGQNSDSILRLHSQTRMAGDSTPHSDSTY